MEIELKLLIAPEHVRKLRRHPALKPLRRGRTRSERLHTIYYDTPERDLAAAGMALRVRRAGTRWIQTLKSGGGSAAGLHERNEWEWPLAGATVDPALLAQTPHDKFFGKARIDGQLAPVFETAFDRAATMLEFADGTRAELAIDHGQVRAGRRVDPISEIEIELKGGDPHRLFELAQILHADVPLRLGHASKAERGYALGASMAPPRKAGSIDIDGDGSAADALRRIVFACIAHMQANEAGVLVGKNPEYLHQLRVGLRRLRACVGLLAFVAPREAFAPLADELKWLGNALGPARDWDVFMTTTLPPLEREFAATSGFAALHARGARLRRVHNAATREAIASPRYTALLLELGRVFCAGAPALADVATPEGASFIDAAVSAREFAVAALDKCSRTLRKRGERIAELSAEERHGVRIAAKKLRYAAEFFASLHARKKVARYVDALASMQDILGALNDAAVVARLVDEASQSAKRSLDPHVLGIVRGWCAAMAQGELAKLDEGWQRFADAKPFWR